MTDYNKVWNYIHENNKEEDVLQRLDEAILDGVDVEYMEDCGYDDEFEFYNAYYNEEAHLLVLEQELIVGAMNKIHVDLNVDDIDRMYKALKELYFI